MILVVLLGRSWWGKGMLYTGGMEAPEPRNHLVRIVAWDRGRGHPQGLHDEGPHSRVLGRPWGRGRHSKSSDGVVQGVECSGPELDWARLWLGLGYVLHLDLGGGGRGDKSSL